jgi:hypothetical protein
MKLITMSLSMVGFAASVFGSEAVQLASNGKTNYQIVIADDAAVQVRAAADDLVGILEQVTGAEFPIVNASSAQGEYQMLVGRSDALAKLDLPIDWHGLGPEGFVIRTEEKRLVLAGGPRRGTINAVYSFLEEVVGCRWYTPKFSVIPNDENLSVGPLNIREVPAFESRFVFSAAATDPDWSARNRLNTFTRDVGQFEAFINNPKLAGSYRYVRWHVHTLGHNGLLPYAEFEQHPEYFALVNGERLREGQPCLTNPQLVDLIIRRAKEWIKNEPESKIISISHGDFDNTCQCSNCDEAYGTYGRTGLYMRFVNQVAAELAKDHPDILVDTLAYHWTRQPPENIKMHENVVVRYCTGGAICVYHPLDECSFNNSKDPQARTRGGGEVYEDLVKWIHMTPRVWVWYYAHGGDKMHPLPIFRSLSPSFKAMRDAGVQGFFIQIHWGSGWVKTGGLLDLQSYLFAKLLWDPDYDVQKGIEEFCKACYGAAASYILSFVELVSDAGTYTGTPLVHYKDLDLTKFPGFHCPGGAMVPIRKDKLLEMDKLFEDAELAVANDPDSLERVRTVRLAAYYVMMLYADTYDPLREKAIREFFPLANKYGISKLRLPINRREVTVDAFRKDFLKLESRTGE